MTFAILSSVIIATDKDKRNASIGFVLRRTKRQRTKRHVINVIWKFSRASSGRVCPYNIDKKILKLYLDRMKLDTNKSAITETWFQHMFGTGNSWKAREKTFPKL